jgi:hypothetical protein
VLSRGRGARAWLLCVVVLTACSDRERMEGDAGLDAGGEDAGPDDGGADAARDAMVLPCPSTCPPSLPVCDTSRGRCVECVSPADCGGAACDVSTGRCERCTVDADCADPAAARCDSTTGRCGPCLDSSDCAHIAGSRCSGGMCTTGRLATCEMCTADEQCAEGSRCVAMTFRGAPRAGGYCLPIAAGSCSTRPFTILLRLRPSLSGAAPADYCGIDESRTTCEAVRDVLDGPSMCAVDVDCGVLGLDDALCRSGLCTYECDSELRCAAARRCIMGSGDAFVPIPDPGTGSDPVPPVERPFCE